MNRGLVANCIPWHLLWEILTCLEINFGFFAVFVNVDLIVS